MIDNGKLQISPLVYIKESDEANSSSPVIGIKINEATNRQTIGKIQNITGDIRDNEYGVKTLNNESANIRLRNSLLSSVDKCRSIEDADYLRGEAYAAFYGLSKHLEKLKRGNVKDPKVSSEINETSKHISWIYDTWEKTIKKKRRELERKSKAINESIEEVTNGFLNGNYTDYIDESVSARYVFYRMSESEMFMTANKMAKINGQSVLDTIPRMVVQGQGFTQITLNELDDSVIYELFESNRYKISCKKAMKALLSSGKVVMVYGEEYRLPTCIPYVVKPGNAGTCQIYVNITPFCNIDQYGKIKVTQIRNYSGLMAILFAACVSYVIVKNNLVLQSDLADGMVVLYSGMMSNVINSLVHADANQKEALKYLSAEFAFVQMYGTEQGTTIFQRYKQRYHANLGTLIVNSIDDTFNIDSFDNMSAFVEELKRQYPIMKGLTVSDISEKWIRRFGSATALSIDYLGFHLYTLCMLLFESPLISRMSIEPLIDQRRGSEAFKRMQQLIESNS